MVTKSDVKRVRPLKGPQSSEKLLLGKKKCIFPSEDDRSTSDSMV